MDHTCAGRRYRYNSPQPQKHEIRKWVYRAGYLQCSEEKGRVVLLWRVKRGLMLDALIAPVEQGRPVGETRNGTGITQSREELETRAKASARVNV
jgi:hypothetical protein